MGVDRLIDDFCDPKHFVLYLLEETHQDKTAADRKCQRVCCTPLASVPHRKPTKNRTKKQKK